MENKRTFIENILLTQMNIPEKLITSYKHLKLNEQEVMVLIQIYYFMQKGNDFPLPKDIVHHMTIDEQACTETLRNLLQKNVLKIKELKNNEGLFSEAYSLEPLFEMLYHNYQPPQDKDDFGTIFVLFEQELARPLSPFEIEMINVWIDEDEIKPTLIKAALREAVLMRKLNFKYIDRILREWKKKGIHSVEQARDEAQKFRDRQFTETKTKKSDRDTSVYYNWLKE